MNALRLVPQRTCMWHPDTAIPLALCVTSANIERACKEVCRYRPKWRQHAEPGYTFQLPLTIEGDTIQGCFAENQATV